MDFDENDAVDFMRSHVDEALAAKYTDDDELLLLVDLIYDYYESNGLLDIDLNDEDDEEVDFDDLVAYVARMLRKDKKAKLLPEDAPQFIKAYLDYEDSLQED